VDKRCWIDLRQLNARLGNDRQLNSKVVPCHKSSEVGGAGGPDFDVSKHEFKADLGARPHNHLPVLRISRIFIYRVTQSQSECCCSVAFLRAFLRSMQFSVSSSYAGLNLTVLSVYSLSDTNCNVRQVEFRVWLKA
jgi:hypothetical protein